MGFGKRNRLNATAIQKRISDYLGERMRTEYGDGTEAYEIMLALLRDPATPPATRLATAQALNQGYAGKAPEIIDVERTTTLELSDKALIAAISRGVAMFPEPAPAELPARDVTPADPEDA